MRTANLALCGGLAALACASMVVVVTHPPRPLERGICDARRDGPSLPASIADACRAYGASAVRAAREPASRPEVLSLLALLASTCASIAFMGCLRHDARADAAHRAACVACITGGAFGIAMLTIAFVALGRP